MDFKDKANEIKKKVHQTSIYISGCSENVKTRFMQLADLEFKNDYGITLKWLLDCSDGLFARPNEQLNTKIDLLAEEVNELKKTEVKPKQEPKVKFLSGRKIGVMNKEE